MVGDDSLLLESAAINDAARFRLKSAVLRCSERDEVSSKRNDDSTQGVTLAIDVRRPFEAFEMVLLRSLESWGSWFEGEDN